MEFSDLGSHCHWDLCRQQTFLPRECDGCNHQFCKKHINKTDHQCKKKELASKQIKSKKNITYKCNHKGCKKRELVDIKCDQCNVTFCLEHRFSDTHECAGPIKNAKTSIKHNNSAQYEDINKVKTRAQPNQNYNEIITFKQNDTIELINLQSRKDWNGQLAVIIGPFRDDKKRWPVELINGKSKALIKPQNMRPHQPPEIISNSNEINEVESQLPSNDEDEDEDEYEDEDEDDDDEEEDRQESIDEIENNNIMPLLTDEDDDESSLPNVDHISVKTMNLCRLNQMDFKALINDEDINDVVALLYVRIAWVKSVYRVCKIVKTMNYPKPYTFMDMKITLGIQVSDGAKIWTKKLTKISNDDFTDDEINVWKQTLEINELPTENKLNKMVETVDIIKKTVELQLKYLENIQQKQQESGSNKDVEFIKYDEALIQNTILKRINYLNLYIEAINTGSNCFWCIPRASVNNSQYIAVLLMKNHKNDKNLVAVQNIAQNQRRDAVFIEIREWTLKKNAKKAYMKSKGWFIDCKDETSANNIYSVLSNFLPHTFGYNTRSNFCRIVVKEFGDAYITNRAQNANNQLKKKASGPKFNYKHTEPTIDAMIKYFDEHEMKEDSVTGAVSLITSHVTSVSFMNNDVPTNTYLNEYIDAINLGSNCFWCIPTTDKESQYIAFLLLQNSENDKNLIAAQHISKNQRQDVIFAEIREFTLRNNAQNGYWRSKGWCIDCKDKIAASKILRILSNFIPHTFGENTPANFCRIVLKEFGDAYMNIQSYNTQQTVQLHNKSYGPKYNYQDTKPSIDAMTEYFTSLPPGVTPIISPIISPITNYLNSYIRVINFGSNCFWCIPATDEDSQYVALLLAKNSKNDSNLIAARQIAKNQRNDVEFAEIREWTLSNNTKKGYFKSKGLIIDCKDTVSAYNIYTVLLNFIPHTFGYQTPSNFCRIVLEEFGEVYMKVQLLSMTEKPKLSNELKNKPFGPKYDYTYSKPSIIAMSEFSNDITNGEYDDLIIDDTNVTINKSRAKYNDFEHMKFPPLSQ